MKKKSSPAKSAAYARGLKIRRKVLGAAHVARATAAINELDADFQRYITESVWGSVWARPGLDLRTRHLITITLLAALGREHELALHLRRLAHTRTTPADVGEALLHVAAYAGVPAANAAFARMKEILGAAASPK